MVWKSHLCRVLMRPRAGPPPLLLPGSLPTKFYSVSSFNLPATGNLTTIINNFKLAKLTMLIIIYGENGAFLNNWNPLLFKV